MPTRLRDGRVLHAARNRDDALRPELMLWDKIVDKFMSNALFSGLVDQQRADEMVRAVERLDACKDVRDFSARYLAHH